MRTVSRALTAILLLAGPVVLAPSAAAAPPPTNGFEKVKLEGGLVLGEIIELAVLPDQKVLYINRGTTNGGGQVRLYNRPPGPRRLCSRCRWTPGSRTG